MITITWSLIFWCLLALGLAVLVVFFFAWYGVTCGHVRENRAAEQIALAKLETERLRAARLQADLAVVTTRAQKLSNDVVLTDLKIETERARLGYAGRPLVPSELDKANW